MIACSSGGCSVYVIFYVVGRSAHCDTTIGAKKIKKALETNLDDAFMMLSIQQLPVIPA